MHKTDTMTEIRRLCRCGHSRHTPTGVCKDYDCGCIYFASIVNDDDTTTAPVPSGDAGSLPVRDFLPAIGAHISEPARFPSHADESDHLLGREPNRAVELAVDYLALRDAASQSAHAILECKQRLASVPVTVETACDLAYVSSQLGFIALRLDAAVEA